MKPPYLAFAALLLGCKGSPPPRPTWPPPGPPPAPAAITPACIAACEHLDKLGCTEAKPTAGGAMCAAVCSQYSATPNGVDPVCLGAVSDCSSTQRCSR